MFRRIWKALSSFNLTMPSLAIVSSGGYIFYVDRNRYPKMVNTFSTGNILAPMDDVLFEVEYFPRRDLEERVRNVLLPTFSNDYFLIKGEVGTGKTRVVTEQCRKLMTERGTKNLGAPIYVLASQGTSFAETLAEAVDFHFDEHINFVYFASSILQIKALPSKKDDHLKLSRVLEAIEIASCRYVKKYGRPIVLVIDNIDYLCEHQKSALERLQEKAKLWSDANIAKIIFICNTEDAETILKKIHSNWSRADSPVVIEDLNRNETLAFLKLQLFPNEKTNDSPIKESDYERIYDAVGGRIQYLVMFKRDASEKIPVEVTIERLVLKEGEKFLEASKTVPCMKAIEALFLSADKTLRTKDFLKFCSIEDLEKLQQLNVVRLTKQPQGLVVTFESKLTETVVKEFVSSNTSRK